MDEKSFVKEISNAMFTAIPGKKTLDLISTVSNAFSLMRLVENRIAIGKEKYTDRSDVIHREGFRLCEPTDIFFYPLTEKLFEIHCDEIIERIALEKDTRDATDAELLGAFAIGSQPVVLRHGAAKLYLTLFRKHFPDQLTDMDKTELDVIDQWQADSAYRDLNRALRQEGRKL